MEQLSSLSSFTHFLSFATQIERTKEFELRQLGSVAILQIGSIAFSPLKSINNIDCRRGKVPRRIDYMTFNGGKTVLHLSRTTIDQDGIPPLSEQLG